MDDGVRAVEMRRELVDRDVRCGPLDLRHLQGRQSAGKAEDGVDFGVARERANKASADISGRADDDDSHLATSDGSVRLPPDRGVLTAAARKRLMQSPRSPAARPA